MSNKVVLEKKKKKEKKKTNYPKQHTMTLNGMKIKLSGAKKSKAYWNRQDQEDSG